MNFIPRAIAKKKPPRCTAVKRKEILTNSKVNSDESSEKPSTTASVGSTHQMFTKKCELPGNNKTLLSTGPVDKGILEGKKCSDQGIFCNTTPADHDSFKNSKSLSSHPGGSSSLPRTSDISEIQDEKTFGKISESRQVQSQEEKVDRLQELSARISSQVSIMTQNENKGEPSNSVKPLYNQERWPREDSIQDDQEAEDGESDEEPPPIVSFSKNQRWPDDDEPVCVVCGKYGEYICDQTEADVCSLECKAKNLVRRGLQPNVPPTEKPTDELPVTSSALDAAEDDTAIDDDNPYIYKEHPDISQLTAEQVQDIRNEVQIFVEGINVERPILEFEQLCLPAKLHSNLRSSGYDTPTPIQMQAIPACLALRDIMVCAQTSSGKTLSFLVPAVITIYNQVLVGEGSKDPNILILTPTRELAMQIEDQAKQLMKGLTSMKTALLVGGLPLPPQLHRLRQGIQFIVGTPGRILEIIKQEGVSLNEMKLVVIDEVDTMLQLGFQQQVYDIMTHLPDNHQTMFTSATIPSSIEKMASSLLNNPVFISVGTPSTPCTSVKQVILWVEEPSKKKKLFAILQDSRHFRPPAIVFVDSKLGADLLAQAVDKSCGISVASLHGDKPQTQRNEILQRFRDGAYDVMISTAVLGRGIDLPGVKMVINFDMPGTVEEYIHQIGRTGRLGTNGTAMTFINNNSKKLFLQFTSLLKPLGVILPQELINSPHLSYHRQQHRSRDKHMDASSHRRPGGSSGYHGNKRSKNRESVTDILKKRKRKFKP